MSLEQLQEDIFDALLLRDSLRRLEDVGITVIPEAKIGPAAAIEVHDFSPRIRFQALQMQQAYVAFFCLENAVRELIAQRLLERHGTDWWTAKVPQKIRDNVLKLRQKEAQTKYLSGRSVADIGYTFFGNLAQIIVSNWEDFSDLFPDQSWITSRFNDLEMCRNIIMHTNLLPEIELGRINSIVRDWLNQVG